MGHWLEIRVESSGFLILTGGRGRVRRHGAERCVVWIFFSLWLCSGRCGSNSSVPVCPNRWQSLSSSCEVRKAKGTFGKSFGICCL